MDFTAFVNEIEAGKHTVYGATVHLDGTLVHSFGDTNKKRYPLYSATKSILALAVGIAADRGRRRSVSP